jgi:teichuronic acid biosynthesis glycosyltransferase TuaH
VWAPSAQESPEALAADGVALLARHLAPETIGADARSRLRDAAMPWVLSTMRCEEAAGSVHAALAAQGVPHAVLKGPGLAVGWQSAFGADLRTYTDLDVLVAERDRAAAVRVLTEDLQGFEGAGTAGETSVRLPHGAPIDLHWLLLNDAALTRRHRFDTVALLARADLSGPLPLLHPVDALLHTCLHALVSNGSSLGSAVDVAALIRLHQYDAGEVIAAARQHRALLAVGLMTDRAALVTDWPDVNDLAERLPGSAWRAACRHAVNSLAPTSSRRWSGAEVLRNTRTGTPSSCAALIASAPRNLAVQRRLRRPEPVPGRVALISLEAWDQVWRRNQHLVRELVDAQLVESVIFVEPPILNKSARVARPMPGVTVVRPPLPFIRRAGGLRFSAAWLRQRWLRDIEVLWVNDPVLGLLCADRTRPVVYDVTDDWRFAERPERLTAGIIAAEDELARWATTVVCSAELARRWQDRYGVQAGVVNNAASQPTYVGVQAHADLVGAGPHVGYVGTLHEERLDVPLLCELARSRVVGTVHLLGPDALSDAARETLMSTPGIAIHPPVASDDVPSWLVAFDVLISPHAVTDFTLSLDAIKAFEYLATDRPVVATPTSGFQDLSAPGLSVVDPADFVSSVEDALGRDVREQRLVATWADRAKEFAGLARITAPRETLGLEAE